MEELNYEKDVEIDPEALDVESLRQASLFYKYSTAEAAAKKNYALAWENVKVVRSRLIQQASEDKALKNAQAVEAFYRDHQDHKDAKQELIEAEYQMNMASAAAFSMRHRKDMIENLSRLAMADYFARPVEPRNLGEEFSKSKEGKHASAMDRAAEKMSRRKRS